MGESIKIICDYCDEENTEDAFVQSDGVLLDKVDHKYYLVINHYRNEWSKVRVKYCPECGRRFPNN